MITLSPHRLGASIGKDKAAIVFLCDAQGARSTWGRFPECLEAVPQLHDWDVFCLNVAVSLLPDAWGNWQKTDLNGLARLLGDYVQASELKKYESLAFLGHSLGGLVIQKMLVNPNGVSRRTGHLGLFAVPTDGVAQGNSWRFWNQQHPDVLSNSDFIRQLRSGWEEHFGRHAPFQVLEIMGFQDEFIKHDGTAWREQIHKLLPGSHASLVQPSDSNDLAFQTTIEMLTNGAVQADAANPRRVAVELRRFHALTARFWPVGRPKPNGLDDPTTAKLSKALDRVGRRKDAMRLLLEHHSDDTDLKGILAGLYKREWFENHLVEDAEKAITLYELSWKEAVQSGDADQAYYHGINLMFMRMAFRDDPEGAMALAPRVMAQCGKAEDASREMWCLATEAQALLTLGLIEEAVEKYEQAIQHNPDPWEFDSMRLHALRVADVARLDPGAVYLLQKVFS